MDNPRIMWVSAQVLSIAKDDDLESQKSFFGGWTMAMLRRIASYQIDLSVVFCAKVQQRRHEQIDGIEVFILPITGKDKAVSEQDRDWAVKSFLPDLIQIEGTEFRIQNLFSKLQTVPKLVSLQGILNGYKDYQYGLLQIDEMLHSRKSIHERIIARVLRARKHRCFDNRLSMEIETMRNANYFTGRTTWDRAYSYWINPHAEYYHCSRILRDSFYHSQWQYEECVQHSIYVSNGSSALKGLHIALEALRYLKKEYPDVKLFVAGPSPDLSPSILNPKSMGYPLLIRDMIKKFDLGDSVQFLGMIPEQDVASILKKVNVYVLTSLIENSPNSLGEAMLLGTPCVAANVGGVCDMARYGEALLYRANDPVMLAWNVKQVFDSNDLARSLSEKGRAHARQTHDPASNVNSLLSAYASILNLSEIKARVMNETDE